MPCEKCGGSGKHDWGLVALQTAEMFHPKREYIPCIVDCYACLGTGLGKEEAYALAKHIIDLRIKEALEKKEREVDS